MKLKKDVFLIQEATASGKINPLHEEEILALNIPILTENVKAGRRGGCVFKTILQEADAVNKNKRVYNKSALSAALKEEGPLIDGGSFFGAI